MFYVIKTNQQFCRTSANVYQFFRRFQYTTLLLTFSLYPSLWGEDKAKGEISKLTSYAEKGGEFLPASYWQYRLGEKYFKGFGVDKNIQKALKYWRKSAKAGEVSAQNALGDVYRKGEEVDKDVEEAVKWFRMSASQGDRYGQYSLGWRFLKGEGVEKNAVHAYLWWSLAAAKRKGYVFNDRLSPVERYIPRAKSQLNPKQIGKVDKWVKEWSAWKLVRGWPENPPEIKGPFASLEKEFGFRVHYAENDIFTGDNNSSDIKADPIRHDELDRLPRVMEKALTKYPPWVVQKYLNRVRFVEDLSLDNKETTAGLAKPRRRSFYVEVARSVHEPFYGVKHKQWSSKEVENTFHHEFAHILDAEFPFPADDWRSCNPKGFTYGEGKPYEPEKDLWNKGFVSNYARTEIDEDFPELSGLILSRPRKAKLIIDNYPRLQAKYRIWLKVYQKIDSNYFSDERLFPKGLFDKKRPNKMQRTDLLEIKNTHYCLYTGTKFSGRIMGNDGEYPIGSVYQNGKKISDIKFSWYPNGGKKYEVTLKNGVKDGLTTRWYENGKLKARMNYKEGKLDGVQKEWHDNGQPKSELICRAGKTLERKEWNIDGTPK